MAENKRFYWLKLKEDFFDSKRIKILRRMAGGDTLTIIYLKMQLKAMQTEGVIEWKGYVDSFAEELAVDLNEEPANVAMLLAYIASHDMAEVACDGKSIFLPYAVENVGSETEAAQKMRTIRERRALENTQSVTMLQQSYNNGEQSYIEKEKDIDIDNAISKEIVSGDPTPHGVSTADIVTIVGYLNDKAGTSFRPGTAATQRHIKARLNEGWTVEDFKQVIDKKVAEWKGDNKMAAYLRPETLFGTKFEAYLQAPAAVRGGLANSTLDVDDAFEQAMKRSYNF